MLLEVKDLNVGYGKVGVVYGASLIIKEGEIVALFGHNGAGKTTILKGIVGALKPTRGEVVYRSRPITGRSPVLNVAGGITLIPQERAVFDSLTVKENLELGAFGIDHKAEVQDRLGLVHELFPALKNRQLQKASTLSGGEQRMLSLGIGLMTQPKLLLLDEPSLGLSPVLVAKLMDTIREIQQTLGTSSILVEQNVKQALRIAQRVYVMKMGRIILEESRERFLARDQLWGLF